jgi:hypothetical protein
MCSRKGCLRLELDLCLVDVGVSDVEGLILPFLSDGFFGLCVELGFGGREAHFERCSRTNFKGRGSSST